MYATIDSRIDAGLVLLTEFHGDEVKLPLQATAEDKTFVKDVKGLRPFIIYSIKGEVLASYNSDGDKTSLPEKNFSDKTGYVVCSVTQNKQGQFFWTTWDLVKAHEGALVIKNRADHGIGSAVHSKLNQVFPKYFDKSVELTSKSTPTM
jgi:hypothetical protein